MSVEAVAKRSGISPQEAQARMLASLQKTDPDMAAHLQDDSYEELVHSFVSSGKLQGRKLEYLSKNKESSIKTMFYWAGGGAAGGAVVGGVCGGLCGCPGGPIGIGAGAGIGAAGGAVVGAVIGSTIVYYDYKKWLKSDEGQAYGGQLMAFCLNDPILQKFCCNINDDLPMDPVKTPNGQIYDRSVLYEAIDKYGLDPKSRSPLSKDVVVDAPEVRIKIGQRLEELIENNSSNMKPEVLSGFKNLQKGIETQRELSYQKAAIQLKKRRNKEELSATEYRRARKELSALYF